MEILVRWWRCVLEHTHTHTHKHTHTEFRLRNYANPFSCSSSLGIATGYWGNDRVLLPAGVFLLAARSGDKIEKNEMGLACGAYG